MKRNASLIGQSTDRRITIYIDDECAEKIMSYVRESRKRTVRFEFIKEVILNRHNNDCYKWEPLYEEEIRDVHAMRFDLHHGNGRIYCKQINRADKVIVVIACELHYSKKSDKMVQSKKT